MNTFSLRIRCLLSLGCCSTIRKAQSDQFCLVPILNVLPRCQLLPPPKQAGHRRHFKSVNSSQGEHDCPHATWEHKLHACHMLYVPYICLWSMSQKLKGKKQLIQDQPDEERCDEGRKKSILKIYVLRVSSASLSYILYAYAVVPSLKISLDVQRKKQEFSVLPQ